MADLHNLTPHDVDNLIARLHSDLALVLGAPSSVADAATKTDLSSRVATAVTLLNGLKATLGTSTATPQWNIILGNVFPQLTSKLSPILKAMATSPKSLADSELGCCTYGGGGFIECTKGECDDLLGTFTPGPC